MAKLSKAARENHAALMRAWVLLKMPGSGKWDVFRVAAGRLGEAVPTGSAAGYALLKRLVGAEWPAHLLARQTAGERKAAERRVVPEPVKHQPVKPQPSAPTGKLAQRKAQAIQSAEFLLSFEWRRLRMVVLTKRGSRCECCGATPKDGVRMNVDHIKPRLLFPELALVESNLQVLCEVCNHGKGNWDMTDWRSDGKTIQ